MDNWINIDLLSNPFNWIIVFLVLLFGAYAAMFITHNMSGFIPSLTIAKTNG